MVTLYIILTGTPGKNLGWMYYESVWYKFGLTNTGVFQFGEYDSSYPQHIGLGRAHRPHID